MHKYLKRTRSSSSTSSSSSQDEEGNGVQGEEPNEKVCKTSKILGMEGFHPFDTAQEYKIMSWNVNGLSAMSKKEDGKWIKTLVKEEQPLVLCLQETKLQNLDSLTQQYESLLEGYRGIFNHCKVKKGYSGTAMFIREDGPQPIKISKVMGIDKHDGEGRLQCAEFEDFFLVNTYVPNSGQNLVRLSYRTMEWDSDMLAFLKDLEKQDKPVIWTGDLNCALLDIDIHDPKRNKRSAGFTDEERKEFRKVFDAGFVDSLRHFQPEVKNLYTYFGYRGQMRSKGKGWRLDYFVCSGSLKDKLVDSYIRTDVLGSDHLPIGLVFKK